MPYRTTDKCNWSVKITGLATDVTQDDLSNQFGISPHRITVPEDQPPSSRSYALIDGFANQEQADAFVSEWNDAFSHARIRIRCELDSVPARSSAESYTEGESVGRFFLPKRRILLRPRLDILS